MDKDKKIEKLSDKFSDEKKKILKKKYSLDLKTIVINKTKK